MLFEDLLKVRDKLVDIEKLLKDCIGFAISVSKGETIMGDGSVAEELVARLEGIANASIAEYRAAGGRPIPLVLLDDKSGSINNLLMGLIKGRVSVCRYGIEVVALNKNVYSFIDGNESFIFDYRELEVLYNGLLERYDKRDWI